MSVRELIALGTASQVPTRFRNHNGYLLLWDGTGILFDPGEGTQRQMTRYGVRAHQIHHVCITHFHGDHCLGLPGVLQRFHLDQVPHPVDVHFPASGRRYFDRLRHASIYKEVASIRPRPHEGPGPIAKLGEHVLSTVELEHRCPAWGYRLVEPDGWRVDPERARAAGVIGPDIGRVKDRGEAKVGDRVVRIEQIADPLPGQKVAFVMDTRPCEGALELARDADLLIVESTFLSSEREEAHAYGHMTAEDAGRLAAEAGARRLLLTHFSQRYPHDAPFVEEAGRFHDDVVAATDGLRVEVPGRSL